MTHAGNAALLGAIEAGGTKFICAVGPGDGSVLAQTRIATTDPARTLGAALEFFHAQRSAHGPLRALGIASFGPVELDRASAQFGSVLDTPKPHWSHTPLVQPLRAALGCPVGFDTDVNGAARAELRWGAGRGLDSLAYVTVGTGIGVGLISNGRPVHGLLHPEAGHIFPRRHELDADFKGCCPFHGDCLEGLASGPALAARTGAPAETLGAGHAVWTVAADYLGQLCAHLVFTQSPARIVMGGGVMAQPGLLEAVRERLLHWLGGYIRRPQLQDGAVRYVVAPGLGERSGLTGAFALASDAVRE